jgi:hypothetical protein
MKSFEDLIAAIERNIPLKEGAVICTGLFQKIDLEINALQEKINKYKKKINKLEMKIN